MITELIGARGIGASHGVGDHPHATTVSARSEAMGQVETERAILDAQYNLRAAVPEHLTYFARYEAESAALRGVGRAGWT